MKALGIFFLFFLTSCRFLGHHDKDGSKPVTDEFYTNQGGWDANRIPLLKPYEVVKLKGDSTWIMSLHTVSIDVSVTNVRGINVIDSVIVVHSGETNLRGGLRPKEAWFIILPGKSVEMGFAKREEFNKELLALHIDSIKFLSPDEIFARFVKDRKIDWRIGYN